MIARLARAVSRLFGIPVGREGVSVRPAGVQVLIKATAFRTRMTPENARALARGIERAAWEAEQEQRLRVAAAAGGVV
jgi:hypothetical protein